MKELIAKRMPGGSSDFLMPNELASGILVQFALQPALKEVYTELLRAEGKELLLAPATNYATDGESLSFQDLSTRARARGEVAIGLQPAGEAAPTLNPPKGTRVKVQEGDKLVVLGEVY